jgi:hypothetical protein
MSEVVVAIVSVLVSNQTILISVLVDFSCITAAAVEHLATTTVI